MHAYIIVYIATRLTVAHLLELSGVYSFQPLICWVAIFHKNEYKAINAKAITADVSNGRSAMAEDISASKPENQS